MTPGVDPLTTVTTGVDRRMLVLPAVVLLAAALLGYAVGHRPSGPAPREQTRTASVAGVLLGLPSQWRAVSTAPGVPGLSMRHAVVLTPGDGSASGLLAGALPAGQGSPLPSQFLARMRQPPSTAVVSLAEAQAYRYSGISIPGFDKSVTLFAIPYPGDNATGLACYAAPAVSADLRTCQHIVATLRFAGRSQSYDLTPQPDYARSLSAAISALNAKRLPLRAKLATGATPHAIELYAGRLAHAFAHAAASVSALQTTLATGQAQSALSGAVLKARAAYSGLASAAGSRSEASFAGARREVDEAEAAVNAALEGFALLGYRPA
jgi:hypothetical protein